MKAHFKSHLFFITMSLLAASCNEEISPDLQSASAATGTGTTTGSTTGGSDSSSSVVIVPPTEYYFKISNSSDVMLNYKLHKTGLGNGSTDCKVGGTSALSSDRFRDFTSTYDISCFFEAEELAMFFNGLSFEIETSQNTCDYVAYAPFSYYNFMPGNSSSDYAVVTCGDGVVEADVGTIDLAAIQPLSVGAAGNVACNTDKYVDLLTPIATRVPRTVVEEADLCTFNYSILQDGAPNCDNGIINISTIDYSLIDSALPSAPANIRQTVTSSRVDCGGKAVNCIAGPIKLIPGLSNSLRGSVIFQSTPNNVFTQEFALPKLQDALIESSFDYANFRRNLASLNIDYGDSTNLPISYTGPFGSSTYKRDFTPTLLDFYSHNLRMDGVTKVIPDATWSTNDFASGYQSKKLAAEPFLGRRDYEVNPFYTFYCLDRAMDIKARVRMMVRDWDRIPATSTNNEAYEVISDISSGFIARQDNPSNDEILGDFDSYNSFNDRLDWDDMIPMERSPAAFAAISTEWIPQVSGANGWWEQSLFPKVYEEE